MPLFSTIGFSSTFSFFHTTSPFLGQQLCIAITHSILSYHSNSAWITLAWFCTLYYKSARLDKDLRDCVAIMSSDGTVKSHVGAFIPQSETFISHSRAFVSHLNDFNSRLKAQSSFWKMNIVTLEPKWKKDREPSFAECNKFMEHQRQKEDEHLKDGKTEKDPKQLEARRKAENNQIMLLKEKIFESLSL
jgi:hypothetical protein